MTTQNYLFGTNTVIQYMKNG